MGTARRSGSIPLEKDFLFLNTKGFCLLCYEECPVQTLEKRRSTTQTSVNFTRLVSRYLGFNIDNVIVAPLKKVGRKCVIEKDQEKSNGKKIDKVGYELCDRCASLAHAFCQVQFQVQFHQMILDRCVRSITEIIKEANKKTTAELFTLAEDDDAMKKQHRTFTRLTSGGLRSATILRNKLYKKSIQKLSKSFPIIKLKKISKSGDWIPFLNKEDHKDVSKNLSGDSKDLLFASLLGCVVSFWIVLSLSFINPEEYVLKLKEAKAQPAKKQLPMPLINCDELEIELKFPTKKKSAPQRALPPPPQQRSSKRQRPSSASSSSSSSSSSNAQLRNQPPLPSQFQPVVIHKHPNQVVQISSAPVGSQYPPNQSLEKTPETGQYQSDPALSWKPKSTRYPTSLQPIPSTQLQPPRLSSGATPVIAPPTSSSRQPIAHPTPQYPLQTQQYHHIPPQPPPPLPSTSSSPPYGSPFTYPHSHSSSPVPPIANGTSSSTTLDEYPQYTNLDSNSNMNSNPASNYNYSYNFTTYNYNSSSTWPAYNSSQIEPVPSSSYSTPTNGYYDPYSSNIDNSHNTRSDMSNSGGYDYGYNYNHYVPPANQSTSNNYPQHNPATQYIPPSSDNMYANSTNSTSGDYNYDERTSYTTLLPPVSSSSNIPVTATSSAVTPMDVDTTNTSTSDEPSLTYEDPQSLDSENSSMNGEENVIEGEDNENGGQQPPQLMFPECHWRQQASSFPPLSCKKPGCTEQFITQAQLELHSRTHGEFQCSFCHLTFSKAHNLAQHEKLRHCNSTGVGKSKCPRCDHASTSQYKYFLHFLTYHLRIPLYDKPCQICNKPFILGTKSINRKNHFKFYHDVDGKNPKLIFSCKGCSAPFLKEAQLRNHQPNCTSIASVESSTSSVEEITYNTALATAEQIVM